MFERFTDEARQVVVKAQLEARNLKHGYIGTEHLLLGLLAVEEGMASKVLTRLGMTLGAARTHVGRIVGEGDGPVPQQVPFAPRAKKALELSLREALAYGCNDIGTEHVLLGLTRLTEGASTTVLQVFAITPDRIREEIGKEVGPSHTAFAAVQRSGRFRRRRQAVRGFAMHIAWEYRVETHTDIDAAWLNELGAEGWELAGIQAGTLVFKRRRPLPEALGESA